MKQNIGKNNYQLFTTRISAIHKLETQKLIIGLPISQKEAENLARTFGQIKNINDGRIAEIPISTIGKILRHKGYDFSKIIEHIPELYKTSILGWSEPEKQREGHKHHPNIKEYHNYINKFSDETDEYYIRFTVSEEKIKRRKHSKNYIHSAFISAIVIYKNGDGSQRIREKSPGETSTSPSYDYKLMDFLDSVK